MKNHLLVASLCLALAVQVRAAPSLNSQLLDATQKGDLKAAQSLVNRGAKVNARGERNQTPLMFAAQSGNEPLVRFLLARGADVKARDEGGFSALGYGPHVLDVLLQHGAKATPGDREWLSDCLENEIWVDSDLEDEDVKADAKLFLRAGMNLNSNGFDEDGTTPLLNAVDSRPSLVPFLLGLGADPNIGDKIGKTPLLAALSPLAPSTESDSVSLLLLKRGAKPNAANQDGKTALMMAAGAGDLPLVKELVRRGANVNARDKRGETALMRAAKNGLPDMARLLLASGADAKSKNVKGETALDYAKSRKFTSAGIFSGTMPPDARKRWEEQQQKQVERALRGRIEVQSLLERNAK